MKKFLFGLSPSVCLSLSVTFSGVVLVMTANSGLGVWMGLECNFFGFLPLISGKTVKETSASMKYFVSQVIGTGLFFIGVAGSHLEGFTVGGWFSLLVYGMVLAGLLLKVGLFPFHFWVPAVMGTSSYLTCFMLSTWQKVGVVYVLTGACIFPKLLPIFMGCAVLTSLIGGFGGVGQSHFRAIMAYSSLVHSGWMTAICLVSPGYFAFYFGVYFILVVYAFRVGVRMELQSLVSSSSISGALYSKSLSSWCTMILLSLGGLPPMVGASIKLLGAIIMWPTMGWSVVLLVFGSVVSLYYYISTLYGLGLFSDNPTVFCFVAPEWRQKLLWSNISFFIWNSVWGVGIFMGVGLVILFVL